MEFRTVLKTEGFDPAQVAVLFHVSDKPALHRALPMLAEEEPALFDAFQNQHGPQTEAMLRKRRFMAAFVNTAARDYCFAGLYEIGGNLFRTMAELDADPRRVELRNRFGDTGFVEHGLRYGQAGRMVFSLLLRPELAAFIGRLFVQKPEGRAYARLAENLAGPIVEITRERRLVPPPPDWVSFIVAAAQVRALPKTWAARLREWRGVYLIVDQDGQRYVGSAYGEENLLGRWVTHVAGNASVTVELAGRNPAGFRFSILELVAPTVQPEAVIKVETSWKDRLDTRIWGLNRN